MKPTLARVEISTCSWGFCKSAGKFRFCSAHLLAASLEFVIFVTSTWETGQAIQEPFKRQFCFRADLNSSYSTDSDFFFFFLQGFKFCSEICLLQEVNSTEFAWGVPPPSPLVLLFRNHTTPKHLDREMPLQQIHTWPEGSSLAAKPEKAESFLRVCVTPFRTKSSPLWQGALRYLCQPWACHPKTGDVENPFCQTFLVLLLLRLPWFALTPSSGFSSCFSPVLVWRGQSTEPVASPTPQLPSSILGWARKPQLDPICAPFHCRSQRWACVSRVSLPSQSQLWSLQPLLFHSYGILVIP